MLEIQKYLKSGGSLDDLNSTLGIKHCRHPYLPLLILNYNQIESPKLNPLVREARGLVLDSDYSLVARSFSRFFNWGEVPNEMELFNFNDFVVETKEDGSLVIFYWFEGDWHVNTRGSFALDLIQYQKFTWREAICKALKVDSLKNVDKFLDKKITYVCEFVSPWNKIVRNYTDASLFLLTAFEGVKELSYQEINAINGLHLFKIPKKHHFKNIAEIQCFLQKQSEDDPTFEGVVIRDSSNYRWKIKNPAYLSLHRMKGDGDNLYNPKNLLPFILKNESDELLNYFPEVRDTYFELKTKVDEQFYCLKSIWSKYKSIDSQKDFALSIKDKTPFTAVLFSTRKKYGQEQTEADLRREFIASEPLILRQLTRET